MVLGARGRALEADSRRRNRQGTGDCGRKLANGWFFHKQPSNEPQQLAPAAQHLAIVAPQLILRDVAACRTMFDAQLAPDT